MALQYAPSDPNILLYRSMAYMLSTPAQLDLALQDADHAIQIDPGHWRAWKQKGETLLRMEKAQDAVDALMNAVGFAQNTTDKLTAQTTLALARQQCHQASPVELPSISTPTSSFPANAANSPSGSQQNSFSHPAPSQVATPRPVSSVDPTPFASPRPGSGRATSTSLPLRAATASHGNPSAASQRLSTAAPAREHPGPSPASNPAAATASSTGELGRLTA